jgi:hypothetical protein
MAQRPWTFRYGWVRRLVAAPTLLAFMSSTLAPGMAWAEESRAPEPVVEDWSATEGLELKAEELSEKDREAPIDAIDRASPEATPQGKPGTTGSEPPGAARADGSGKADTQEPTISPQALPTGGDKSGVTSQAISMPKGSGTVQGMGESFSAQLSTGIATFSVPFAIPTARGGAQASLGLSYSSSGGAGLAGMGWDVGVPFIARQTDRGLPKYEDKATWHAEQDRFVFNGGQELVPICDVTPARECARALPNEVMPPWSAGYQYFRPRVEGSFLRFFWSPNHQTWRVQDKSGVTMELGVPLDGSGSTAGLVQNPDKPSEIYKWNLVRQYDTYGNANPASGNPTPNNVVVYRYAQDGGNAYLSDIFHTSPASEPWTTEVSLFAHHVRLVYEDRTDPTESYRSGWKLEQRLRLSGVDVTSKTFAGNPEDPRRQVRRYHLKYAPSFHQSFLESVQVEGRCAGSETAAFAEDEDSQLLPETTGCETLPPMTFGYGHVTPRKVDGSPGTADLAGFEGFDERLIQISNSPDHSIDEGLSDLFDINSDGLPDVLVTAPGTYNDDHAVFFNGSAGAKNKFGGATHLGIQGVLGANSNTIKLSNANVVPLDLDGDGRINLLHMPAVKTYAIYSPEIVSGKWKWVGRTVTTASGLNPKIDFGKDTLEKRVVDVNFDGLVDLVESTGTEFHTFFALGRYADGDGQFGEGSWSTAASANLSNNPEATCVPWSSTPVRFSDNDIQLAEMNGDGIPDIVRIRRGDIRYWPGRGNGVWGTGKRDDCPAGTFSSNRYVTMSTSPYYSDVEGTSLRVDDVNGDGLDDLVQVRYDAVDVWLNVDGKGWTEDRHVIEGTPPSASYANRVRLVDVNGSGTRDILWGSAEAYQYIDLAGGLAPAS